MDVTVCFLQWTSPEIEKKKIAKDYWNVYNTDIFYFKISIVIYINIITLTCGESKGYLEPNLKASWNFSPSNKVPGAPSKSTIHLQIKIVNIHYSTVDS